MVILPTLFSSSSPLLHRYPAAAARRMPPAVFHPDSYALCEPRTVFNLERCLRMNIGAHKGCDPWKALAYAKSNADYKRLISLPRRDIAPENAMRLGRCSTSAVGPLLPPPPAFAADTAAFGATTVRRRGGPARRTREKEKSTGWAAWAFESRRMRALHVTCVQGDITQSYHTICSGPRCKTAAPGARVILGSNRGGLRSQMSYRFHIICSIPTIESAP